VAYILLCLAVFVAAYLLNIYYVTVLYHRGLTHGAVRLRPFTRSLVVKTGNWVTGLDPKGWACMHRLHHLHSDTPLDPHSPSHNGLFALMLVQLRSYNGILVKLIKGDAATTAVVKDLDFEVSWLNRRGLWLLPYLLHAGISLAIVIFGHAWLLGAAYYFGMLSHPIQGWMVNALAHRFGYRNYATPDDSKNNTAVALLVFGEGYQNNHHHRPRSAKFSVKWFELDLGYALCRGSQALGLLDIVPLVPAPVSAEADGAAQLTRSRTA